MGNPLRLLILAALAAFLAGCPGWSDSGPPAVTGTWSGTQIYIGGFTDTVTAAIIEDGPGFIYTSSGRLYAIEPMKDQENVQTRVIEVDAPTCISFGCVNTYFLQGTAGSNRIELSATGANATHGTGPIPPPKQIFAIGLERWNPSSEAQAAVTAGQWQGYYLSDAPMLAVALDVKPDGSITGSDAFGCSFNVNLQQQTTGTGLPANLYRVDMSGTFDPLNSKCDNRMTGVGYFDATGIGPFKSVSGTYFFMGVYPAGLFGGSPYIFGTGYLIELKVQ